MIYLGYIMTMLAICIFLSFVRTIFPYVEEDEFFVDKYGEIHGKYCPKEDAPWFTTKYDRYNILIERDQYICNECLSFEEDKLFMLHKYNLKKRIQFLKSEGLSVEEISDDIKIYKVDFNSNF